MDNLSNDETANLWLLLINFLSEYAGWLVVISLLTTLITIALVPVLITRIPVDYFSHHRRRSSNKPYSLISLASIAAKNILGAMFLLIGVVLLFLPGQGLILIFVGMLIMNYPGKYALEQWLIQRRGVLPALNAIRFRYDKQPLLSP